MYERLLAPHLSRSTRNALLLGPRQVGKSTLLASLGPDWTINLASPRTFADYARHPERLERELAAAGPEVRVVLLDEVQRVPGLLDAVQVVHDARPGRFRFLLSGSSARKLRRGEVNLLPGRVNVHSLHPLVLTEAGSSADVEQLMACGSLPGILAEADPAVRAADLRSYADTYLREEVQSEALVRDVGGFGRLLDLVAASSGRILNLAALAGDAGIRYETARRYLSVLVDTLVAFEVPAWSGADRGSLVAHPKLFLFDVGVRNALLRRPLDAPSPDERGLLFEHLVTYELSRRTGSLWPDLRLFHFRTRHGAEVDLVADLRSELWAIEVKASRSVEGRTFPGLDAFAERAPGKVRKMVVYLGDRDQRIGVVDVMGFEGWARGLG